jgi:hypothetical protein
MRLITALMACAAIALLPACGTEDLDPAAIADAAQKTTATGGSRVQSRIEMTLPDVGKVPIAVEGVMDTKRRRARLDVDMSALARRAGGELGKPGDWRGQVLMDGLTLYMTLGALTAELPDDKRWIKFDLAEEAKASASEAAQLDQLLGRDPSTSLRYLRAVSEEIERVGGEQVRGVSTTRYKATIEVRRYPELLPVSERAEARKAIDELISVMGTDRMPIEVWVDDESLVRRTQTRMTMREAGERIDVRERTDYFDFGTAVDVEPPPAGEVVDASELGAQAG